MSGRRPVPKTTPVDLIKNNPYGPFCIQVWGQLVYCVQDAFELAFPLYVTADGKVDRSKHPDDRDLEELLKDRQLVVQECARVIGEMEILDGRYKEKIVTGKYLYEQLAAKYNKSIDMLTASGIKGYGKVGGTYETRSKKRKRGSEAAANQEEQNDGQGRIVAPEDGGMPQAEEGVLLRPFQQRREGGAFSRRRMNLSVEVPDPPEEGGIWLDSRGIPHYPDGRPVTARYSPAPTSPTGVPPRLYDEATRKVEQLERELAAAKRRIELFRQARGVERDQYVSSQQELEAWKRKFRDTTLDLESKQAEIIRQHNDRNREVTDLKAAVAHLRGVLEEVLTAPANPVNAVVAGGMMSAEQIKALCEKVYNTKEHFTDWVTGESVFAPHPVDGEHPVDGGVAIAFLLNEENEPAPRGQLMSQHTFEALRWDAYFTVRSNLGTLTKEDAVEGNAAVTYILERISKDVDALVASTMVVVEAWIDQGADRDYRRHCVKAWAEEGDSSCMYPRPAQAPVDEGRWQVEMLED